MSAEPAVRGLVDLHCHVHPGVDDGPESAAESAELLRAMAAVGVATIAATSHVRPDKEWMNTAPSEPERAAQLARIREDAGVDIEVVRGAEHYVHEDVFGDLERFARMALPYGRSRWLLVETPYGGLPPHLPELFFALHRKGFRVLLAHVERFPYLEGDDALLEKLRGMGVRFQVNVGSLAGVYSRPQQRAAERLLKRGLACVLAGDCHRAADVERNIVAGLKVARKLVGDDEVRRLYVERPGLILDDAPAERV